MEYDYTDIAIKMCFINEYKDKATDEEALKALCCKMTSRDQFADAAYNIMVNHGICSIEDVYHMSDKNISLINSDVWYIRNEVRKSIDDMVEQLMQGTVVIPEEVYSNGQLSTTKRYVVNITKEQEEYIQKTIKWCKNTRTTKELLEKLIAIGISAYMASKSI